MVELNKEYKYYIFEGLSSDNAWINNKLIPWWRQYWRAVLSEINSDECLQEDEIGWQKRLTYITDKDRIVAMHFFAHYSAKELFLSDYAKRYLNPDVLNKLPETGCFNTMQYLSVDPAYSYRHCGINFASVLSDMSGFHHHELGAKQTLGVMRKAVGIHNLARKVGFKDYSQGSKYGVDVSIMYCDVPKRHPRKSVSDMASYFWQNRIYIN